MYLHVLVGSGPSEALVNARFISYVDVVAATGGYKVEIVTETYTSHTYRSITTYAAEADAWDAAAAVVQAQPVATVRET